MQSGNSGQLRDMDEQTGEEKLQWGQCAVPGNAQFSQDIKKRKRKRVTLARSGWQQAM